MKSKNRHLRRIEKLYSFALIIAVIALICDLIVFIDDDKYTDYGEWLDMLTLLCLVLAISVIWRLAKLYRESLISTEGTKDE